MVSLLVLLALLAPFAHGPRDTKQVALTFDLCPTNRTDGYDEAIVEVLRREDVAATMFLSGRWVETHQAEAKDLARSFEIASHGYRHIHMDRLTLSEAKQDLARAQRTIEEATGKLPQYFRPPSVKWNEELLQAAKAVGLTTVTYDVASGDPDPNLSADGIVRYIRWKTKPGSIVIYHANGRGWTTSETLPQTIADLRQRGYDFVTVSELLVR